MNFTETLGGVLLMQVFNVGLLWEKREVLFVCLLFIYSFDCVVETSGERVAQLMSEGMGMLKSRLDVSRKYQPIQW